MTKTRHYLDFEQPIAELEGKIEELRHLSDAGEMNIADEVGRLQAKAEKLIVQTYQRLTPWQKVQVARHPERPHCLDYVRALVEDFTPLAGDRLYGEDAAIIGGLGRIRGMSCVIVGNEKGHDVKTRMKHNFGMARPEGYRKAQRLMAMAERFHLPVVTFVDTSGAYPGVGAEERGQAEAIARSIEMCLKVKTPVVSLVIGEGGSGGAIALAAADRVYMLQHAVYSVISPEGCASILWRSAEHAQTAAEALKLTAQDLIGLKLIDGIVPEPLGGAHRDRPAVFKAAGDLLEETLRDLKKTDGATLRARRREKFLAMGRG